MTRLILDLTEANRLVLFKTKTGDKKYTRQAQRRKFTNHPNRPCKLGEKSESVNKSVIVFFCLLNISIFRICTYSSVLTLFSCVTGCEIWVG